MKPLIIVALLMVALPAFPQAPLGGAGASTGERPRQQASMRSLAGQVKSASDAPLSDAVVYLKNTKTLAMKTFITDGTGNYRFNALSPNVDYEVFAEHKGKKSDTKTLSAFDSRDQAYINLKIK
jgi:hypothetical protein